MVALWLLNALHTSLLTSILSPGIIENGENIQIMTNTTQGTVKGQVDVSSRVPVVKFLGIPYARPPLGELTNEIKCLYCVLM